MSKTSTNGDGLDLTGIGAAYIRVSDDQQDTQRQYEALHAFEKRHGVTIAKQYWFTDQGWARDTADKRPEFQRMMKLAGTAVKWIVVDRLDRFGVKSAKQLFAYLFRLEEAGCRLFDAGDREWTGEDDATEISAWVEGKSSAREQREKSHRVLSGKVARARAGEWQGGGPVCLGFDVTCFHRATNQELWRVVAEGHQQRLRVFPDGRSERFDGADNFPACQKTEVLRLAPSKDKAKINAAVSVFQRYAVESISFHALAKYLNGLGFRTGGGGNFQGPHVESMLSDPIFIGYYAYNREHYGKFHRWKDDQPVLELNYEKKVSANDKDDWVQSGRLFPPLVDQKTWAAVQEKLASRQKRARPPRRPACYLAGLVHCANCGKSMFAKPVRNPRSKPRKDKSTGERFEYICGSYFRAVGAGRRRECLCHRNSIGQATLEKYVNRYLEESKTRLELLTEGVDATNLTGQLERAEEEHWQAYLDGIKRLMGYLAEHHPDEYADFLRLCNVPAEEGGPGTSGEAFMDLLISTYRAAFDPAEVAAEVARLDAEHTALTAKWADLPTPLAKEKATKQLEELEGRLKELRNQQQDAADVVVRHYREAGELCRAIIEAQDAMRGKDGERALRQRAQALRAVIQRIECRFIATDHAGGGWGKKSSELVEVTFYPVAGDEVRFYAGPKGALIPSGVVAQERSRRVLG
jgi:DNA invertase Pin-like site-specific DNA recombinase